MNIFEDATEKIIYIRWDVGLIASEILCECKILTLHNINLSRRENDREHWP